MPSNPSPARVLTPTRMTRFAKTFGTTTAGCRPIINNDADMRSSPHRFARAARIIGRPKHQQGLALVAALLVLVATALLIVSSMGAVVLQERMAGSLRDRTLAEGGADSAVRTGEQWLWKYHQSAVGEQLVGDLSGSMGVLSIQAGDSVPSVRALRTESVWNESPGAGVRKIPDDLLPEGALGDPDQASLAHRPQFAIEHLGVQRPPGTSPGGESGSFGSHGNYDTQAGCVMRVYRISGRSTGASANTIRVAESYYSGCTGG